MQLIIVAPAYLHRTPNVFTASEISVYWDQNCSQTVSRISWGNLSTGETKSIVVYVQNEGNESVILVETVTNWNPADAWQCLTFSWSCGDERLEPGAVVEVTQRLSASPSIQSELQFSFDISFEGRQYYLGDVNKDGKVDMADISIVIDVFMATPERSGWNPIADLNNDIMVDMADISISVTDFGKEIIFPLMNEGN
jgi:hypothetical protein